MAEEYVKCLFWREAKISLIRKGSFFSEWWFGVYLFSLVFSMILNHLRHSWGSELSQDIDYHLMINDLCEA